VPGNLLDDGVTINCPHGGSGSATAAATVKVGGGTVLTKSDLVTVSGCSFNVSGAPSPCLRVEWKTAALKVTAGGNAVLLSDSVGLCVSAAGAPQGPAQVSGFQTKVTGR
jgi:hypothetical protein